MKLKFGMNIKKRGLLCFFCLLFVLAFLSPGFFVKTVVVKREKNFQMPVKEVFTTVVDPRKMKQWLPQLEKFEPMDGTVDKLGTNYLITLRMGKRKRVVREKLLKLDWYKKVSLAFYPRNYTFYMDLVFSETPTGTLLQTVIEIKPNGFLGRATVPYMKHGIGKQVENSLNNVNDFLLNEQ